MKIFGLLLLFLVEINYGLAQPGEYGSDLLFTFRNENLKDDASVVWNDEDTKNTIVVKPNKKGEFIIESFKTPVGGWLKGNITIYYKKDTMVVYPPFSDHENIILDIPFQKGKFIIPNNVYHVQKLFAPQFRKNLAVHLEADWSIFEVGKENPLKTVVLRRKELFQSSDKMNSLLPSFYEDNTLFSEIAYPLKHYFIDENYYKKIIGNRIYTPRRLKYYFFGIVKGTNQYFLQREKNSLIEYGTLEIPIERYMQEENSDCYRGLLYPNLEDDVYFSLYSLIDGDIPVILGYYHGVKKCDESFGSTKQMWGIFEVLIDTPNLEDLKQIRREHSTDNNLIKKE